MPSVLKVAGMVTNKRSPSTDVGAPGDRQLHVDAALNHRGRHHEDDEQHQHHVHERDDVDLDRLLDDASSAPAPARLRLRCLDWTVGHLGEVPLRDVQKFHGEVVHLRARRGLHALRQVVVRPLPRGWPPTSPPAVATRASAMPGRRHQGCRARSTNPLKRHHDADHGAEQPDERRDAGGRRQKRAAAPACSPRPPTRA